MQKIQQLVAAAVGLDADRGDQLIVENVSFDEPVDEPAAGPTFFERVGGGAQNWARPAIVLVVGLVALLVRAAADRARRVLLRAAAAAAARRRPASRRSRCPGSCPGRSRKWSRPSRPSSTPSSPITCRTARRRSCQRRVVGAIETEPENAARLLRAWLAEDEA